MSRNLFPNARPSRTQIVTITEIPMKGKGGQTIYTEIDKQNRGCSSQIFAVDRLHSLPRHHRQSGVEFGTSQNYREMYLIAMPKNVV